MRKIRSWGLKSILFTLALVLCFIQSIYLNSAKTSSVELVRHSLLNQSPFSKQIRVHGSGRGNTWLNLQDGYDLPLQYSGPPELEQVLKENLASPLALASGDFDEDGVPD